MAVLNFSYLIKLTAVCQKVHSSVKLESLQRDKFIVLEENFQRRNRHVIDQMSF
jgi:hypothetical protein